VSLSGTAAYRGHGDLPPLVAEAVRLAERGGFALSCAPEQGRLLQLLAAGRAGGVIGETGTGCGVGVAWLLSGAGRGTRLVSVEREPERAAAAAGLFAGEPDVTIRCADWSAILADGPFDLLVLDGGGAGKGGERPVDPAAALRPQGAIVVDDFTPADRWPPQHAGAPDAARLHWLEHPSLAATELRLTPTLATVVGLRRG
jgi:predicted O-methyltransferase YrrM